MDAVTMSLDKAGTRKAAILLASLEESAADALLERLDAEQADLVRQATMALDEIDAEERGRVIEEFRRIGPMVPRACPPGIELDGLSAPHPANSQHASKSPYCNRGVSGDDSVQPGAAPFDFLSKAEHQRLAQLLGGERPPTVALVLSHLPPERAGEVLACFAPALQVEVVRRLADIENTDPETVHEIQRALESRWSQQFAAGSVCVDNQCAFSGSDAVAKILAACDPRRRGRILDNLAAHDQPLAERLGRRSVAFDDIAQFDDATLLAVLRAAEPEVTEAALLGAPPAILDRFLRCMSPEAAKSLRYKLDHPNPIRLSDVEEARRQIAALAQRLSHENPDRTNLAA